MTDQNDIIPRTPDTPDHGRRYTDEVKELAFLAWIEAGRNAARAHRLLLEKCADTEADDNLPLPSELPDEATLRRWVKRYDWDAKLTQAVADHFPAISAQQAARLIMQTNKALDEWDAVMDGERDHLSAGPINARVALINLNLQLRGLGTAGAKGGEPTIERQDDRLLDDPASLSPNERARRQRERLEQQREKRRKA